MDIISHTLTGVAVGTVVSSFSKNKWYTKISIILIGGLGGALPDFDALSLWSKFDSTIGKIFSLTHTGNQIYFGKLWYSHHGAFHSMLTPILISIVAIAIISLIHNFKQLDEIKKHLIINRFKYLAFCIGFIFHLLEDMPTPGSVWGGVNLFFPSTGYIGGFGKIWWWNNYDLVLIITLIIAINIGLNFIKNKSYQTRIKVTTATMCLGIILGLYQVLTRPIDFSYTGHTKNYNTYERQSKEIQKDILGEKLYNTMEAIDNMIPLYF